MGRLRSTLVGEEGLGQIWGDKRVVKDLGESESGRGGLETRRTRE